MKTLIILSSTAIASIAIGCTAGSGHRSTNTAQFAAAWHVPDQPETVQVGDLVPAPIPTSDLRPLTYDIRPLTSDYDPPRNKAWSLGWGLFSFASGNLTNGSKEGVRGSVREVLADRKLSVDGSGVGADGIRRDIKVGSAVTQRPDALAAFGQHIAQPGFRALENISGNLITYLSGLGAPGVAVLDGTATAAQAEAVRAIADTDPGAPREAPERLGQVLEEIRTGSD